jgi:hypothetical protein
MKKMTFAVILIIAGLLSSSVFSGTLLAEQTGTGTITGTVTDILTGDTLTGVQIQTDAGVSSVSVEGYYLMLHPAGTCTLTAKAIKYDQYTVSVTVAAGQIVKLDIAMTPSSGPCPATAIYGDGSDEIRILHAFRDTVLSKSRIGRQIIKLYYMTAPPLLKSIEGCSVWKTTVKAFIDSMLPFIKEAME